MGSRSADAANAADAARNAAGYGSGPRDAVLQILRCGKQQHEQVLRILRTEYRVNERAASNEAAFLVSFHVSFQLLPENEEVRWNDSIFHCKFQY